MSNKQERANKILAQYPSAKAVFFTSDSLAFIAKDAAAIHAKSLEDKTIDEVERTAAPEAAATNEADKTFAEIINSKTVNELKAVATELGIAFNAKANKAALVELILAQAEANKAEADAAREADEAAAEA